MVPNVCKVEGCTFLWYVTSQYRLSTHEAEAKWECKTGFEADSYVQFYIYAAEISNMTFVDINL